MATIVNERDVLLQATVPRMLLVASNFITVSSTTNTFSTTATAVSPTSIVVRANLSGELRGTVTWTVSPSVPVTINGNVVSVPNTSVLPGTPVTLTATLTLYGQTYTASTVLSNVAETVTSGLSANAILISTGTDGTGGNYASATSTMTVNIGTADNSSAWTFLWTVPAGVTATGINTRTITISDMTVDGASLTCVATRTGWPTQTRVLVISKSKAGTVGTKTATIYAYKRSATAPTGADAEPGTVTYSFASNTIITAALANSWQKTIPSGPDPLYIVVATAATTTDTDTVDASEWTDPVLLAQNGNNGLNTASVFLYARNSTPTTAPTLARAGSSIYTFSNGSISGQPSGWTRDIPAEATGTVVWVIQATAGSTSTTDTIPNSEWSDPQILAQRGAIGQTGEGVSQIYIRSELTPTPNPPNPSEGTPAGWSPTIAGASGTAALWTSFGARPAGATQYTWQVATRVQGEAGNPLRNASGFLYFSTPQASAPGTPSASGFNFATGNFSTVTAGWATTFNVPSGTTTALWAVRYSVQETVFGGAQTVSISTAFTHQNFNGLVTFTNDYITSGTATTIANTAVSNAAGSYATNTLSNVTTIDGGKITTGSLNADKLEIGRVRTGDYIRMFDNKIVVYTGNQPRVIIGNLA
jgi:hypothetical protein